MCKDKSWTPTGPENKTNQGCLVSCGGLRPYFNSLAFWSLDDSLIFLRNMGLKIVCPTNHTFYIFLVTLISCCCLNTPSTAPTLRPLLSCLLLSLSGFYYQAHSCSLDLSSYITLVEASQTVQFTMSLLSHYNIIMCILFLVFTSNNMVCNLFIYLLVHKFIIRFTI